MPKLNKRTRQSQDAINKRWKQAISSEEGVLEISDAEPDKFDESLFDTFWIEGEETCFDSDEVTDGMQALKPNTLEQLVENAKTSNAWAVNSRRPVYNGAAQSTLRNKKAYWRKAASGFKKITEMFPTNETAEPNTDLTFEDMYDSSDDDDNEFTLEFLD